MGVFNKKIPFSLKKFQQAIPFDKLFESIAEGVLIIDTNSMIVYVNSKTETLFGYAKNELLNQNLNIILPERLRLTHEKHVRNYFDFPKSRPMGSGIELSGIKKDNTEIPLEISLNYLQTKSANYGMAFIIDNTARKKAENELKKRNIELDSYAHTGAHDLNSTLNGIIGLSELLLYSGEEYTQEDKEHLLKEILEASKKMSSITHELLIFATMKKEDLDLRMVNMKQIINECLNRLKFSIIKNSAQVYMPENFCNCLGYGPWIEEIWYNFINNAINYGGIPPVIGLKSEKLDNGFTKYSVIDNGKGLTEEQKANLFKLLNTTKKGYGLGLSIVKSIIEKLEGYITIESEPGKGSEFSFYLKSS